MLYMPGNGSNFGKKDLKEMLEDFYGERMYKIHKKFPKQFLQILMKGSGLGGDAHRSSADIKKELAALLFDTVFYVVCEVVYQTRLIAQGLNKKTNIPDTTDKSTKYKSLKHRSVKLK